MHAVSILDTIACLGNDAPLRAAPWSPREPLRREAEKALREVFVALLVKLRAMLPGLMRVRLAHGPLGGASMRSVRRLGALAAPLLEPANQARISDMQAHAVLGMLGFLPGMQRGLGHHGVRRWWCCPGSTWRRARAVRAGARAREHRLQRAREAPRVAVVVPRHRGAGLWASHRTRAGARAPLPTSAGGRAHAARRPLHPQRLDARPRDCAARDAARGRQGGRAQ